jgi:hypothetical protein
MKKEKIKKEQGTGNREQGTGKKGITFFFLHFSFLFLLSYAVFGQDLPLAGIVDDSALRTSVKDTWLVESPGRVLARPRVLHTLPGGGRVELRTETSKDEFMVIFARELKSSNGNGGANRVGNFPGWAQGSWILTRRRDNGNAERIRIFLRSDPYTYIQFRPFVADKCHMDVVLYDAYIVRSVPLPVTLERLYTMQLGEVLNLAGDQFPRRYFEPKPSDYRLQRQFITKVRERIKGLEFADDGAIDQNGNYVYINTGLEQKGQPGLNCSGFAKWLVDGILKPVTGERLEIPPLKEPFGERGSSLTDLWEKQRDPFFGLDWVRNLASAVWTKLLSPAFGTLDEIEVRTDPFSQMTLRTRNNTVLYSYPGFLENAGYGVEGLLPLLYTLAIDDPGKFYLAAVNNEIGPPATQDNPKGQPRMRQYFHIAAFIPYFTEGGVFQIAVFESAAETSISAFRNRYPLSERSIDGEMRLFPNGHYVNLVRLPVEAMFKP